MTTCAKCLYSRPHGERGTLLNVAQGEQLQCWRYPPVPFCTYTPAGLASGSMPAIVASNNSCGEFAPKPEAAT